MKIAIVVVLGGDLVRSTEHVGIGYIASCLRNNNYEVSIIEVKNLDNQENYQMLLSDEFDIIGFTTTCITMKYVINLASIIKVHRSSVRIICGGHMATFRGEEILKTYPQVDYVIFGEGEVTFLELVGSLERGDDVSTIKGLGFRNENNVIINEGRELIKNLDELPYPARDQFEQHDNRFQYLRIASSRGCLGNCGFCSSFVGRNQAGERWRGRSPKNVVDEIEYLVKKYDYHTFDFVDSTFEDPGEYGKERIRQIAQEIIDRNLEIYYNCCFRAENWNVNDSELLALLVESGLEKVNIGFESGNNNGLRILNKRATIEDNWNAIRILAHYPEIYITFGFIMFHPFSSIEDIYDNAKFLHGTGVGQVIRHYFWQLEVYPGTLIEQRLKNENLLKSEYNVEDGMYNYNFIKEEAELVSQRCKEFLKIDSVWDFEIFDIIIHTFIRRMRHKYNETSISEKINGFSMFVDNTRKQIADFNYEFFIRCCKQDENYNVNYQKELLDRFLLEKMDSIRQYQYKMGLDVLRTGMKLVRR